MKNIDRIYDPKLIEEWENFDKPQIFYTLAVDATFDSIKSYCLTRGVVGGKTEILLIKSVKEENVERSMRSEFEIEVDNLSKYFNARIVGDWPIK